MIFVFDYIVSSYNSKLTEKVILADELIVSMRFNKSKQFYQS